MNRITIAGLLVAVLLVFGAVSATAQESGNQILSMEYGTIFGYDLNAAPAQVVSGQGFSMLFTMSPELQAGVTFVQGTAPLNNISFFRLRYGMDGIGVNLYTGQFNGALGFGAGADYTLFQREYQGVMTNLTIGMSYFAGVASGINNGTIGLGISAGLGM